VGILEAYEDGQAEFAESQKLHRQEDLEQIAKLLM